jgi:hypothetical protein
MDLENGSVEVLELIHHEGDRGHMSVVYHVIATGEVLHVCRSDMAWEDRMGELAGVH